MSDLGSVLHTWIINRMFALSSLPAKAFHFSQTSNSKLLVLPVNRITHIRTLRRYYADEGFKSSTIQSTSNDLITGS